MSNWSKIGFLIFFRNNHSLIDQKKGASLIDEQIDLLEKENENTPNDKWGNPSQWIRNWVAKIKTLSANCQQVLTLVNSIDQQNEYVSPRDNWGNPSAYLRNKINEMRIASKLCSAGFCLFIFFSNQDDRF
jgi:hypothetical protein